MLLKVIYSESGQSTTSSIDDISLRDTKTNPYSTNKAKQSKNNASDQRPRTDGLAGG
jgi:hypothetical protein